MNISYFALWHGFGAPAAEASKSKFATSSYCCVLFMVFSFVQLRELSPVYRGSLGAGAPGDSGGQYIDFSLFSYAILHF